MTKYENYKKNVLEASLWLSEQGYFGSHRGSGGNVSVRISEDAMAITPSSVKYQELSAADICVIGFDLSGIEGNDKLKPSVESGMHSIIYQAASRCQRYRSHTSDIRQRLWPDQYTDTRSF